MKINTYMHPIADREDKAGRKLDAAGKLLVQLARQDLKKTKFVDRNRTIQFTNTR